MKYLSIDLEATGLDEDCKIIEFAAVPIDVETKTIFEEYKYETLINCPSFEELKPSLNDWVIQHNEGLIRNAHSNGITNNEFKKQFSSYLESNELRKFFNNEKIVLFGKSLNAIDLPFLNRDLGWSFMRDYFSHRQVDLSSIVYALIDSNIIPKKCESGSELMEFLNFGEVAHTAYEDAKNTGLMYFKLLEKINP